MSDLGLEIVRGERPLADVSRLGVSVSVTAEYFHVDAPLSVSAVVPSTADVATGFLAHINDVDLREWATVLLGAEFIDLLALEADPNGEIIIDGLWAASTGEPLAPSVLRAITTVLGKRRPV
jgi:hypothetical protein